MRRYVCVYFPYFSVERITHLKKLPEDAHIVLTENIAGQNKVKICSPACQRMGIKAGISVAEARALDAKIQDFHFEALPDFKLLYKIAVRLLNISPLVAIDNDLLQSYRSSCLASIAPAYNCIFIDISGCARLYQSEQNLLKRIADTLSRYRVSSKIGISSTAGSAWCCAHYGEQVRELSCYRTEGVSAYISAPGTASLLRAATRLPISGLRVAQQTEQHLIELGLVTIAQLLNLCPKQLARRFGRQLVLRLKQFQGAAAESFLWLQPSQRIYSDQEYSSQLFDLEVIRTQIVQHLKNALQNLNIKCKQASSFTLFLQGNNPCKPLKTANFFIKKDFELHTSSNNERHILGIITPLIDKLPIEPGVQRISIFVRTCVKSRAATIGLMSVDNFYTSHNSANEFINKLAIELGDSNLKRLVWKKSHIPEKSFAYLSINQILNDDYLPAYTLRYPTNMLSEPFKIDALALAPDSPPVRLIWNNNYCLVKNSSGPEKITTEWWQHKLADEIEEREYYRVQLESGYWLWIFHNKVENSWFLHGLWL